MKERAGKCEHRKLYHDRPLCALPQQTGSQLAGLDAWMAVSRSDCGPWCGRNRHSAYVGARPCDTRDASRSGLNYASATGDPIPNLWEQKLPLLTQEGSLRAMTFQAAQCA